MNIKISDMTLNDITLIEPTFYSDFDDYWNINILKEEIKSDTSKYFVAKSNNEIIGFIGIKLGIDSIDLMNIVVKKSFRTKGVGTILLNHVLNYCNSLSKYDSIILEVNANNIHAIQLYKNYGFKVISIRKKYYNNIDDAIIMILDLKNI